MGDNLASAGVGLRDNSSMIGGPLRRAGRCRDGEAEGLGHPCSIHDERFSNRDKKVELVEFSK